MCTHIHQESITVGGVYSCETSNDICAWAACTILLIAVLLLRRATYKKTSHDTVDSWWSSDDTESSTPHLVVSFFAITIDALTQLAVLTLYYTCIQWVAMATPPTHIFHSMLLHEALTAVHSSYGYGLLHTYTVSQSYWSASLTNNIGLWKLAMIHDIGAMIRWESSCILLKYSMILTWFFYQTCIRLYKMLYLVIAPVSCISRELSHYISLIQVTARYRPDIFGCVHVIQNNLRTPHLDGLGLPGEV